jgi:sugar phosphate isomerase/epimerase
MKTLMLALLSVAAASATGVPDRLGLQLYSLRALDAKEGWAAELNQARDFGFLCLEGGSPPKGLTAAQYKAELASRGLKMVSMHFQYDRLERDLAGAVAEARELGVRFACNPWIPHAGDTFTVEDVERAAADFNAWGAAFRAAGITFAYHPHGFEFRPAPGGGTLFDLLAARTKPELVSFELDVFWATHGGQDAVALMKRYPDRWRLMHVKDLRKGAPTGIFTGKAPATDDVAVGSGQVDWPAVLREARAVGVQWYFIEDESTTPMRNIPQSVAYMNSIWN